MQKAHITRLQKLIDAVPNSNYTELWQQFSQRMKLKEQKIAAGFNTGDEVWWKDKGETLTGTIIKINKTTCRVKEDNTKGFVWNVSASLLSKSNVLQV
jgi:hypothetical protein